MNPIKASLIGRTIDPSEVRSLNASLVDQWRSTQTRLPTGEVGWYRRLLENDRVGVVATAQGILGLKQLGCEITDPEALLHTLLKKQRSDGSWSFVSNLDDRGVVDATAWTILALVELRGLEVCGSFDSSTAISTALNWLEENANPDGGWGICAGQRTRAYSSALAVRALAVAGREKREVTLRGLKTLLTLQDHTVGGWRDATGALSVPATASVLLTFADLPYQESKFSAARWKATHWLLQIARTSSYWSEGPHARPREEVEVYMRKRRRRVEFGFSPRPMAIDALIRSGHSTTPIVMHGFSELLLVMRTGDWEKATGSQVPLPTSWMLYDVGSCISSFKQAFKHRSHSIWVGRSQVVEHSPFDGAVARQLQRHKRKMVVLVTSATIVGLLRFAGVIANFSVGATVALVGVITVNVLSNFLTELIKGYHERR